MIMPVPSDDYSYGQMMGMLCIIRLIKTKSPVPAETIDKIERLATESLSGYLQKPEEDIILLVDNELGKI